MVRQTDISFSPRGLFRGFHRTFRKTLSLKVGSSPFFLSLSKPRKPQNKICYRSLHSPFDEKKTLQKTCQKPPTLLMKLIFKANFRAAVKRARRHANEAAIRFSESSYPIHAALQVFNNSDCIDSEIFNNFLTTLLVAYPSAAYSPDENGLVPVFEIVRLRTITTATVNLFLLSNPAVLDQVEPLSGLTLKDIQEEWQPENEDLEMLLSQPKSLWLAARNSVSAQLRKGATSTAYVPTIDEDYDGCGNPFFDRFGDESTILTATTRVFLSHKPDTTSPLENEEFMFGAKARDNQREIERRLRQINLSDSEEPIHKMKEDSDCVSIHMWAEGDMSTLGSASILSRAQAYYRTEAADVAKTVAYENEMAALMAAVSENDACTPVSPSVVESTTSASMAAVSDKDSYTLISPSVVESNMSTSMVAASDRESYSIISSSTDTSGRQTNWTDQDQSECTSSNSYTEDYFSQDGVTVKTLPSRSTSIVEDDLSALFRIAAEREYLAQQRETMYL